MRDGSMGIPLEYERYAEYFDVMNTDTNTDKANRVLARLLSIYSAKNVLDLACGTASQMLHLSVWARKLVGVDISPAMLEIAKDNARRCGYYSIQLVEGDMRTAQMGTFNAVITMSNAIGHLTPSDFERTLKNVAENLEPKGIYIFDILNAGTMTDKVVEERGGERRWVVGGTTIHRVRRTRLDRTCGQVTVKDDYTIQKGQEPAQHSSGTFRLQLYTARELDILLERNGFKVVERCGINQEPFIPYETSNIFTVAQKQ